MIGLFCPNNTECSGVLGSSVNDTIVCGEANFAKLKTRTESRFEMKPKELPSFELAGVTVGEQTIGT